MTGLSPQDSAQPRTSVRWRLLALLLLLVLLAPATLLLRKAASRMEYFDIRSVLVEGTRYLAPDAVVEGLALDSTRSIWDDTGPLAERLLDLPQVAEARITRRLPATLVVHIREKAPVAFAPGETGLEPVDSSGAVLPIDPSREALDLPVVAQRDPRIFAMLASLRAENPAIYRRVNEVTRDGRSDLVIRLERERRVRRAAATSPAAPQSDSAAGAIVVPPADELIVRASLGVSVTRFADIFPVESDLSRRRVIAAELDLRYRDQVIARLQ